MNNTVISIFNYADFRLYIKDYYEMMKKENKKFSQRYFALKLGLKSHGFLSDIISGRRNISSKHLDGCVTALSFDKFEADYFENLVFFNQAKTVDEKNRYYKRLLNNKKVNMNLINKNMYEYFSKWYHIAIREMLYYFPFDGNYRDLSKQLVPAITEKEAKESVELQQRLNIISENEEGVFNQTSNTLTTGNETFHNLELENFQLETMELAKRALDTFPADQRDISTLSLSLSKKGFSKAKQVLQDTRKQLLKEAQSDSDEERVYQINFQLFPLSKKYEGGKHA
ncbi:MAG: TIGR02147 family protein [Fibrobacterales bacterium]